MANCSQCKSFFEIPEGADDFTPGKGDCVRQEQDAKGKWYESKPVMGDTASDKCPKFAQKN
ncbi:benzylsuccinate synthase gamma subunit family protein [Desulfosporosinus sp. BICA1-9]|uniref:benzylsuccinate synthase gamma subunit family protein n=1 Tax=Desulfosporosinus sp. BICA1-9 TaxID=1531958 RepID=UPI00054C16B9|nr:benzylsuccinate synthase gamma subunit family protein [Desulfosporosinus sp. BICA1-9]KJS48095.1 MAG: benzylsuccinate synthase [Peptococcaceae bacterium BRH_c23]KJS79152.1 MAG: benzylsuccinate synthase [Desulfosporosinus sp. BICA1-9]HBW38641.1 benzylsuccinate synthase subunit gamma [Desulfosporosinus sp.]